MLAINYKHVYNTVNELNKTHKKGTDMKTLTVRQARKVLFYISCEKADNLRRELFNIHEQDKPLTGDLLTQFYTIAPQGVN